MLAILQSIPSHTTRRVQPSRHRTPLKPLHIGSPSLTARSLSSRKDWKASVWVPKSYPGCVTSKLIPKSRPTRMTHSPMSLLCLPSRTKIVNLTVAMRRPDMAIIQQLQPRRIASPGICMRLQQPDSSAISPKSATTTPTLTRSRQRIRGATAPAVACHQPALPAFTISMHRLTRAGLGQFLSTKEIHLLLSQAVRALCSCCATARSPRLMSTHPASAQPLIRVQNKRNGGTSHPQSMTRT